MLFVFMMGLLKIRQIQDRRVRDRTGRAAGWGRGRGGVGGGAGRIDAMSPIDRPKPTPSAPGANLVGVLADERSELLARKYSGEELSPGELERLETLTASLREALPQISPGELEVLLEMTEGVESIRERARERRQRLGLG